MNPVLNKKVQQKTELRASHIVHGHYDKLKQALLNITINAYQAMNDTLHPEIWVRSYDEDDRVVLEIQDNGSGITRDNLKRVFEPFHTTKPGGHGLGLMIVQRIMRMHGGQVGVESREGKGTVVTLQFPRKDRRVRMLASG